MISKAKAFAVLAVVFMLLSAVPVTVCDCYSEGAADNGIPSSYDLRNTYKNVTSVRDQGSEGLCWAFAMSAALEGEMINMGYDASTVLSPLYEAVRQYDAASYSGEGDCNVLHIGELNREGAYTQQTGLMAADGKGPMYEYIAPYEEFAPAYEIDSTIYDSSTVLVKQVDYYDPYDDADEIKSMLMQGHIGIFAYHSETSSDVAFYTTPTESDGSNHAVALIGWDDNYSKDNFKYDKPEGDGAWIIKNSWGTSVGDGGYVYVSYYNEISYIAFFSNVTVNDGSEYMYSYDHGYSVNHDLIYRGSAVMGNVFTSERDESLTGTSFSIYDKYDLDQAYSVYVYKLDKGYKDASQGQLVASSVSAGVVDHNGTYYVEFDNPVQLKKGDIFSICIEFTGDTIDIPIDTTEDFYIFYTSYTVASPGQSYVCYDGKWTDISADGRSNVRIKAHTSTDIAYEASVNGTIYERFTDAVSAAKAGESVKLLGDVTTGQLTLSKDINLILCGHTLTFKIDDPARPAISVSGCTLRISYGKLVSASGNMIVQTGGELSVDHIMIDSSGLPLVTDGTEISLNGLRYSGENCLKLKGGSAELSNSNITCTGCIIDSDGCDVNIRSGLYQDDSGDAFIGDICVYEGVFYGYDPKDMVHEGSYSEATKSKSGMSGYEVYLKEVSSDSGDYTLAEAFESGGNVKLLRDVTCTDTLVLGDSDMTLDLNGHTLSVPQGELFFITDTDVSLVNTSDVMGTVNCATLLNVSKGSLTVGDNIEVNVSVGCCSPSSSQNITISDKSVVQKKGGNYNNNEIYRYTAADGALSTTLSVDVIGDYGGSIRSYSGPLTYTEQSSSDSYAVSDGKAYDSSGKLIGRWDRTYSAVKEGMTRSTETVVDRITAGSDISVSVSKVYYVNGTKTVSVSADAVAGKEASITATLYGNSHTLSVDPQLLETAKKSIESVLGTELSGYEFSSIDRTLTIVCYKSENKILEADTINGYLNDGYNIFVCYEKCGYSLIAGTGVLSGDTVIKIGYIDPEELNEKQDKAVTTGIVFELKVTVDSIAVSELPCDCKVMFFDTVRDDSRFYVFDENGGLTELRAYYHSDTRSYEVELGKGTVFVKDPVSYSESGSYNETAVIAVTAVAAAATALCTCLIILRRRL